MSLKNLIVIFSVIGISVATFLFWRGLQTHKAISAMAQQSIMERLIPVAGK